MWQAFRFRFGRDDEERDDIEAQLHNLGIPDDSGTSDDVFFDFPSESFDIDDEPMEHTTNKGKEIVGGDESSGTCPEVTVEPTSKDKGHVGEEEASGMCHEETVEPTTKDNGNVGEEEASGTPHEGAAKPTNKDKGNVGEEEVPGNLHEVTVEPTSKDGGIVGEEEVPGSRREVTVEPSSKDKGIVGQEEAPRTRCEVAVEPPRKDKGNVGEEEVPGTHREVTVEPTSKDKGIVGEEEAPRTRCEVAVEPVEPTSKDKGIVGEEETPRTRCEVAVEPPRKDKGNVGEEEVPGTRHEASSVDKNVGDINLKAISSKGKGVLEEKEAESSGKRPEISYPRDCETASCTDSDEEEQDLFAAEKDRCISESVKGEPSRTFLELEGESLRNRVAFEEVCTWESAIRTSPRRERSPSSSLLFRRAPSTSRSPSPSRDGNRSRGGSPSRDRNRSRGGSPSRDLNRSRGRSPSRCRMYRRSHSPLHIGTPRRGRLLCWGRAPRRSRSPFRSPPRFRSKETSYNKYLFLIIQAIYMLLCAMGYLAAQFFSKNKMFKGGQNGPSIIVDSVYFVVVSFTTVGYGDITPNGVGVKVVTCVLVLLGVMLMPMVFMLWNEAIDSLDDWLLAKFINYYMTEGRVNGAERRQGREEGSDRLMVKIAKYLHNNGVHSIRKKIKIRIMLAAIYALVCTGLGHLVLLAEHMSYEKMLYTAVITQTTVGFGDLAFNSTLGRSLASMWILLAAAATSRFLDLLVQSRLHKCFLTVLQKEMSASELEAVGITQCSSDLMFYLARLRSIYMIDEEVVDIVRGQLFKFRSNKSSRKKGCRRISH